jgi:hypothetical protein
MCGEERNISMGTRIRAELSEKNKYWISRHRYYELKHFCLQYPLWKKAYAALDELTIHSPMIEELRATSNIPSDPTAKWGIARAYYSERMDMVKKAAMKTDEDLYIYILKAVTEELSYNYLKTRLGMPCGKDMYYDRYRKFFWILSKERL